MIPSPSTVTGFADAHCNTPQPQQRTYTTTHIHTSRVSSPGLYITIEHMYTQTAA